MKRLFALLIAVVALISHGALLPSGHRVTHIGPGSVTLEINGQQTQLNL